MICPRCGGAGEIPDGPARCAEYHPSAQLLCELDEGHTGPHLALQHNDPPVTWDG